MAGIKGRSGPRRNIEFIQLEDLLRRGWSKRSRLKAIRALAAKAEEGDVKAARLLLEHSYGRPTQRHEVAGPAGGPVAFLDLVNQARLDDNSSNDDSET